MAGTTILRMTVLVALLMAGAASNAPAASSADGGQLWERYKALFLTSDGRVVDHYQNEASHSEGQGYALLLAVENNDRQAFQTIWNWTKTNLRIRHDALFVWRWGKRANGTWDVMDYNSATDGDILIAFGLLKGHQRWHDDEYRVEALKTVGDLRTRLALNWQGKTFLLPGYFGFSNGNKVVLNPSYNVFPAYRLFSAFENHAFWDKVNTDAYYIISKSYFGQHPLPPDWIAMHENGSDIFREKGSLFGAEAVRVILYLAQENTRQYEKGIEWMFEYFQHNGELPQWVDLDNNSVSINGASAGTYGSFAAAARRFGKPDLAAKLAERGRKALDGEGTQNYYSFSLFLLGTTNALEVKD